jgi:ABC-type transport system substrate-binding protein
MGEKWPATLTQDALNKLCPFKDVKAHQAFIYGIDRFTIADKLLYGKGKVVAGYWPNSQYEDKTLEPYDPEKA